MKIVLVYFLLGNYEYDVKNVYEDDYKLFLEKIGVVNLED